MSAAAQKRVDTACHACGTWSLSSLTHCPGPTGSGGCGARKLRTLTAIADAELAAKDLERALWRISTTAATEGMRTTETIAHVAIRALRLCTETVTQLRSLLTREAGGVT